MKNTSHPDPFSFRIFYLIGYRFAVIAAILNVVFVSERIIVHFHFSVNKGFQLKKRSTNDERKINPRL